MTGPVRDELKLHRSPGDPEQTRPTPLIDPALVPGRKLTGRLVRVATGIAAAVVLVAVLVGSSVTVDTTMKASGVLEPGSVWVVRSSEDGVIRNVLVEPGNSVTLGQPLFVMDSTRLRTELIQLRARRDQLAAELGQHQRSAPFLRDQSQAEVARTQILVDQATAKLRQRLVEYRFSPNADSVLAHHQPGRHVGLDVAVAEVQAARAARRVAVAGAALGSFGAYDIAARIQELARSDEEMVLLQTRLRQLVVLSPAAGVVITDSVSRLHGAMARAGSPLFEIADLNSWRARLSAREDAARDVRIGDRVAVSVPALNTDRILGKVIFVGEEPSATSQNVGAPSYRIDVLLDSAYSASAQLRRGFIARGDIITGRATPLSILARGFSKKLAR